MTAINEFVYGILTPSQHAAISKWLMLGDGGTAGSNIAPATRSTARKTTRTATRTTSRKATATASRKISPTEQTLINFFAVNPGGHSEAALAALPGIAPNVLGKVLKAKSSPFRKSGDLWLMRGGATVSRELTQPLQQAA